jgi:hypothetical protein
MAIVYTNGVLKARTHEKVSTLTSSIGFASTSYDVSGALTGSDANFKLLNAEEAVITVETADIRWTIDGTVPTVTAGTALGHLASAGDVITISGYENIKAFRAINAVAASGSTLRATFMFRQ